jgi:hypothetical protein
MVINTSVFTEVIKKFENIQKVIAHINSEHRDLLIIRLKLLNGKLKEYGASIDDINDTITQADVETQRVKVQTDIERKNQQIDKIKKEIILSSKAVKGKKEQRQKKIQLDRVDRMQDETQNDF